ncbi:MAG: hypothetical protein IJO88_03460 [Oscillospiraceae bacterium]|nr:hypothetical protein [Oscillospiraceae bacterium]
MVKGITRQVIVIRGEPDAPFDQAIFLVRDDIISKGGITEDLLLKEAKRACRSSEQPRMLHRLLWSFPGAAAIGVIWLITVFLT